MRQVQTSSDQLGRTHSEGPGTSKTLSDGPGTLRKQHQTTITQSHRVPGPSGQSRRVLGPSGDSVRRSETTPNHQNHENRRKWTHMARNELRIRPFEAHSHFLSIANPPRPQIPPENSKNQHFSKNPKIRKSGNPPGSAAMGGAPLIYRLTPLPPTP